MGNPWVEFVRQYRKDNNISYGCAISEAGPAYRSTKKGGNPKQEKEEREEMMGEDFDTPKTPTKKRITVKKSPTPTKKSKNPWINFVKTYSQENGIKYNEALKEIKRLNLYEK